MTGATEHICRGCGKPLVSETTFCASCGAKLAMGILAQSDRDHRGDIVLAFLTFGITAIVLYSLAGFEQWSLGAMIWRTFLFGVPIAAVLRKWYFLMLDVEPDYGRLWHVYWLVQIATWLGSLAFAIVIYVLPPAAAALWSILFL